MEEDEEASDDSSHYHGSLEDAMTVRYVIAGIAELRV